MMIHSASRTVTLLLLVRGCVHAKMLMMIQRLKQTVFCDGGEVVVLVVLDGGDVDSGGCGAGNRDGVDDDEVGGGDDDDNYDDDDADDELTDTSLIEALLHVINISISGVIASCGVGYCSLVDGPDKCTISADTLCSIIDNCNGNGQCLQPRGGSRFCNCTDDRFGDSCEFVYKRNESFVCTRDTDCIRGTCGPVGKCACNVGFRGDTCEIETWVILKNDNSCENGGLAYVYGYQDKRCYCPCGFNSPKCGLIDYTALTESSGCDEKICNGNGYCRVSEDAVCHCHKDLSYGKYCEDVSYETTTIPINVNTSSPSTTCTASGVTACQNGGICTAIGPNNKNGETRCICPPDFEGNFCETDISPVDTSIICSSQKKCLNGGVCGSSNYVKRCVCRCGYFGTTCKYSLDPTRFDFSDQCNVEGRPCWNGGTCYAMNRNGNCELNCACPPLFTGEQCELFQMTTTAKSPCDQIYTNSCAGYRCSSGSICVTDECGLPYCVGDSPPESGPPAYLAAVVSVTFAALIVITALIAYWLKKRRRQTSQSSPSSAGSRPVPRVSYIHSSVVYDNTGPGQTNIRGPSVHLQLTVGSFDTLPTYEQAVNTPELPPAYSEFDHDCDSPAYDTIAQPAFT